MSIEDNTDNTMSIEDNTDNTMHKDGQIEKNSDLQNTTQIEIPFISNIYI
jgi:hypothetical protein